MGKLLHIANGEHDCTFWQAKIMRLTESAPAVAAAGELLDQLKNDNADLQADNERLLSYVETLEATGSGGINSGALQTNTVWHRVTSLERDPRC